MSVYKHTCRIFMYSIICVGLIHVHVTNAATSSKRHLTNNPITELYAYAARRTRSPTTCRNTCYKLQGECSSSCFPPRAIVQSSKDVDMYKCFEGCMSPESNVYAVSVQYFITNNLVGLGY